MRSSISFAILALLASAGTTIAAPLPHHSSNQSSSKGDTATKGDHHALQEVTDSHPVIDASVKMDAGNKQHNGEKHHHARADNLAVTKSLTGVLAVPTADGLGNGGKKGKKMDHSKGPSTLKANDILSPTSNVVHSAIKPLNSDTTKVGQQLNHPNSGEVGQLGKTGNDALEPQETEVSKNVLPRDIVSTVVNSNGPTKPIQTAATGMSKNVVAVNGNANGDIPVVGGEAKSLTAGDKVLPSATGGVLGSDIKSVTSGGAALPSATSAALDPKGNILDNGLVGSTGIVITGATGSLTTGQGSLLSSQSLTGTVGKLPNTAGNVLNGANIDPLSNPAYQVNTDGTESDAKKITDDNNSQAHKEGHAQTNKHVNNLAFSGNGTDHRFDGHPGDGTKNNTTQLIDNTQTVDKTGQNVVGVNTDPQGITSTSTDPNFQQKGTSNTVNSASRPIDPVVDQALPASQKTNGSLVTVDSSGAKAKVIQTPGTSNNIAETNSNDITGSKSQGDNVNLKVALPQQAGKNGGNIVGNNGKVGPNDQKGNVAQQVTKETILQKDVVATSTRHSKGPQHTASHLQTSHYASASSSHPSPSKAASSTIRPQVFVEYTSFSSPTSTIASQSASLTSATPLAEANVHSGTIQVNQNHTPTLLINLKVTSSVPLPSASIATLHTTTNKARQAKVTYGEKGEHVVACDGKVHQANDLIDECINADLLDLKPNQTEACPVDMQHDIHYGISTNDLSNTQAKDVQKYVRLCLAASAA
ncbi:uncharacterized protein IL334_002822 [Kwoniella shivajii]|uniref:Uncharacterized protein n=1 Tax=Kwoniella shivajii TaxID=564305 RepID=A0ABZ1CYU6_9TREE|nr:hypothetical protein IL334_002822 [Kwoniella shivajii]